LPAANHPGNKDQHRRDRRCGCRQIGAGANVTADAITTMTTGSEVGVGLHRFGRWVPAMTPEKQATLPAVKVEEAGWERITAQVGPWCSSDPRRDVLDWEVTADLGDMPALGVSAPRVGQVHRGDDFVTMAASGATRSI
jgi:hypothetical protein